MLVRHTDKDIYVEHICMYVPLGYMYVYTYAVGPAKNIDILENISIYITEHFH